MKRFMLVTIAILALPMSLHCALAQDIDGPGPIYVDPVPGFADLPPQLPPQLGNPSGWHLQQLPPPPLQARRPIIVCPARDSGAPDPTHPGTRIVQVPSNCFRSGGSSKHHG